MALIQCPDCETEVSDAAPACPKCARPLSSTASSNQLKQAALPGGMAGQRIAILICAIVGMVATFLPWASIGLITVAGSKGDGWITFAMLLVPLVLAVRGDRSADFTMPTRLTTLGIGAGVAAFGAWKVFDILGSAEPVEYSGIENSIGAGLYLVIVAGVALIVTPYLIHKK